ncbi:ACP S-malonyltransferase [Clostridium aminobutyricum]|uniref:Malonyl CoA-acyl carrier protein transacylase n=1 Tax=Clostridium aminobutyricum TaxID=33953 RepID=A0A939D859_CLOAM|nr:ACP S-malonyltransferase [Clostridium aminobutyricum]MBN7772997.1 ACP S-malonyltransferase [Clostridium aminobutyricum]
MKIGLLFVGQGAQYTGMGKELYEHSPKAKEIMELAGDEIKAWCFEGTKEMLRQTHITQPCIYTVTMAAYEALFEGMAKHDAALLDSIEIVGMAGFSLGEYAALTASGSISDIRKGMEIVTKRGNWMNEAGLGEDGEPRGGMVAAFGDRQSILDCVAAVKDGEILQGVNFNSPVQTVVAGEKTALERFKAEAKIRKMKAIPLSVGTAFHSEMMAPAAEKLQNYLMTCKLKAPTYKLYSNITAEDLMAGLSEKDQADEAKVSEYIADRMGQQAMSPVCWQDIIENMVKDGIECVIEIGPGSALSGMVKKIKEDLLTLHVEDMESLKHTIDLLAEHVNA